jgi:hypothetical protein
MTSLQLPGSKGTLEEPAPPIRMQSWIQHLTSPGRILFTFILGLWGQVSSTHSWSLGFRWDLIWGPSSIAGHLQEAGRGRTQQVEAD